MEQIKTLLPDIITLQELDNYEEFYAQQLKDLGYDCYYEMKIPDKDGILIGWQKSKLLERSRGVKKLTSAPNTGEDIYLKKQLAIYVDLQPVNRPAGPFLKIVNTHLFWDYKKENIK